MGTVYTMNISLIFMVYSHGDRYHVGGMPAVNESNTAPSLTCMNIQGNRPRYHAHLPTAQDTLLAALG